MDSLNSNQALEPTNICYVWEASGKMTADLDSDLSGSLKSVLFSKEDMN